MGDFKVVLEAKLSVETELSLEDERDLLLDGPGLNINLVGTIFFTAGDKGGFVNDSEGVLVFTAGDGVLIFAAVDNDVFIIGDDGVFTLNDSGVFTVGDDGIFTTAIGLVFATGDFGIRFLVTDDDDNGVTLAFKVNGFDTGEVVDFIVEEDLTESSDKELDSFLTIAFEDVAFDLEITVELLAGFKEDVFAVLVGSLVNFKGEVGVFTELDFRLEVVDKLFDITGGLFVGVVGLLALVEPFTDSIGAFLTGVVGFATIVCSFDFNDVVLSLFAVDVTDLEVRVEEIPVGDFGTVEFILDTTEGDFATGEDTADDLGVKVDLTGRGDVVEDLTPVVT